MDSIIKMPEKFKGEHFKNPNKDGELARKWTKEELDWCIKMKDMGYSDADIAWATDRGLASVGVKMKRLKKKNNNYNSKHIKEKYEINNSFFESLNIKTILDAYCGENSYWRNNHNAEVITNDIDENVEADYHMDALELLCKMYCDKRKFDLIDLDPFGSSAECFDLAIKMATKGIVITLGEMGHKRWKRLDFVSRHYNIDKLDEFESINIINKIIKQAEKHKKKLEIYTYKDWQNISRVWFKVGQLKIEKKVEG